MAKIKDILSKAFGGTPTPIEEVDTEGTQPIRLDPKKEKERVDKYTAALTKYRESKSELDSRIIENDRWYRSQHWDVLREQAGKQKDAANPEPVTAYLWNTLANRHGDLMDAYPEPVFSEREPSDKSEAERLSKIVKVVLERNKFRKTYSDNSWCKTKGGTSLYHIAWDQSLEGGLGDISVKKTDILRLYWESGIDDIQNSKFLFALALMDTEQLQQKYPILSKKRIDGLHGIDVKQYSGKDRNITDDKTLVIDAYTKEIVPPFVQPILHMDKIVGDTIVSTTRDGNHPKGLYEHGLYPFVVDVMFPEEDSITGFGFVDIVKNPQLYIDKLDSIIMKNALVSGKQRVIYKDGGGINPDDLADLSKDFIPSTGSVRAGEDYMILQSNPLGADVMQHRQNKITELKEVSGANDFNRGSSGGGVTAASAIMALQEAGNKLSRAMVANTYDAYTAICYQVIQLIAQFYEEPRKFRITGNQGDEAEYVQYDNSGIKEQSMGEIAPGVEPETRKPIFDIVVHAEKYSPYAAVSNNLMAKELFSAGFFNPELAPAALTALDMMSFDGKDVLVKNITAKYQEAMQIQQAQAQAQSQVAQNQEIMLQMNEMIKKLTGKDMLAGANIGQQGAVQTVPQQQ